MAGFLKTEENRRLAVSAGSAAVVYILLFLFFSVYSAAVRREPQAFGASAVYLNLTRVSQAAVRAEGANPGSGSSAKQSSSTQSAAAPERPAQAVPEVSRPAAAEPVRTAAPEERTDDFFADTAFGESESVSAGSGTSADFAGEAAVSEEGFFDSGDYSRLDSALAPSAAGSGSGVAGDTLSAQTASAAGLSGGDSVSVVDLDGLTAGRKLLYTVDPDFSGVDTAGRSGFSFVIAFDLNADGTLSRIVVTDSSGSTTADRRMEQALRQWRFAAADGGEAVHVRLKYYVRVR